MSHSVHVLLWLMSGRNAGHTVGRHAVDAPGRHAVLREPVLRGFAGRARAVIGFAKQHDRRSAARNQPRMVGVRWF